MKMLPRSILPCFYFRVRHGRNGEFVTALRCPACLRQHLIQAGQSTIAFFAWPIHFNCPECGIVSKHVEYEKAEYAKTNTKETRSRLHTRRTGNHSAVSSTMFDYCRQVSSKHNRNVWQQIDGKTVRGIDSLLAARFVRFEMGGRECDTVEIQFNAIIDYGNAGSEGKMEASSIELRSSGAVRAACLQFGRTERTEKDWILVKAWAIREFQALDEDSIDLLVSLAKESYRMSCVFCKQPDNSNESKIASDDDET